MPRKTSKFMVGLFVTVGVFIGLVAIIWLGASNYFEKGLMYVTYFDESVQGLQADSAVKYRGVEVSRGKVARFDKKGNSAAGPLSEKLSIGRPSL